MKKRSKYFLLMSLLVFSVFSFTNNQPIVAQGDQVTVQYSGSSGDASFDTMIVTFHVGEGEVIPGLDQGVIGMRLGEEKNLTLTPDMAFGEYNLSLIAEYPYEFFTNLGEEVPYINERLTIDGYHGRVIDVNNETVLIDYNHELAGKSLNMTVKLLAHSQG